jgi:sugar transferase (PEP-CTERM system associated)
MARIFRHYVSPIKLTLAAADFAVVLGGVFLAESARHAWLGLNLELGWQALIAKIIVPMIVVPILLGVGGYQSDAIRDTRVFAVRLMVAIGGSSIALAAFLYLLPMLPLWRSILLLAMLISGALMLAVHGLFLRFAGNNFLSRRVLILGSGKDADDLKKYVETATEAGLSIVGTVTLSGHENVEEGIVSLDDIGPFDLYAHSKDAEMILISDAGVHNLPIEALIACKLGGIEIKDRLSFYEQVRGYVDLSSVQSEWIIFSDGFRGGNSFERASKRVLDIGISLVALVLTTPILLLAAVAIRFTSRGPVFYLQERVGLNSKPFRLLKFRSMKVDAEKEGQPEWAKVSDPRVTLVGGFLRRTRIDELPQIVNVLKGDMSFVGPRPERPFFVDQFKKDIPFYRERHCLKPGITGWAQIQYPYGASFEDSKRKLEYDLYYIKNYSIFLDILIILQTVRVVLFPISVR